MLHLAEPKFNEQALHNVEECIKTGWISSQGSFVKEFEQRFADYIGVKHAISTSSGTAALRLALAALGIATVDDEVLVPSFTFIATANVVKHATAEPVFCDSDPNTWCINTEDAESRITESTKVIMPVHINGHPCNMKEILRLAVEYELFVIEDACQALGTTFEGHRVGSLGHIGCFSFFANKQLTTGEGGMCTTNCDKLAEGMRILRDHGRNTEHRSAYVHDVIGFNYRMTNLQAAVGVSQLSNLSEEVERRRKQYCYYYEELGNNSSTQDWHVGQSPWLYHHRLHDSRQVEEVISELADKGIEAKPFYTPCHQQKPYRNLVAHRDVSLPTCEALFGVMLPLHAGVTKVHMNDMKRILVNSSVLV